jgi:hypothetical protein
MDVSSRTLCVPVAVVALLAAGCGSHSRGGSAATSATAGHTAPQTAGHASAATGNTAPPATGNTAPQTAGHAARHSAGHAARQTARHAGALAPARKYLVARARTPHDDDEASEYVRPAYNRTSSYRVSLSAGRSAAAHSGGGGASAVVRVHHNRVCWRFGAFPRRVVASRALGRTRVAPAPSAAAIHSGARGSSGPVVVVLGARFAQRGCVVVRPVVANSIAAAPRYYYLSVVTARDRTGALRGQL